LLLVEWGERVPANLSLAPQFYVYRVRNPPIPAPDEVDVNENRN
jgi:hypothetical protein